MEQSPLLPHARVKTKMVCCFSNWHIFYFSYLICVISRLIQTVNAPGRFGNFFSLRICGGLARSQRPRPQGGKPPVLLFTFHPYSPLTHGCYPSEQSTNQLWPRMGPAWTVCLLLAALVSALGKRGWNQVLISRTDCLFFHCLCPSDEQGRALTHDPFH